MKKIGITGGIASGKSAVCDYLISKGYGVLDCDLIYDSLLKTNAAMIDAIKKEFGKGILNEDLPVFKKLLREKVFNDARALKKLESITHPFIFDEIENKISAYNNTMDDCLFICVPLLFETNSEDKFDKIVSLISDVDIRLERLSLRGIERKLALKIIGAQSGDGIRKEKSDYLIYNNSDIENLKRQADSVLKLIVNSEK